MGSAPLLGSISSFGQEKSWILWDIEKTTENAGKEGRPGKSLPGREGLVGLCWSTKLPDLSSPSASTFDVLVLSQDEPQAEKCYLLGPAAAPHLTPCTGLFKKRW